MQSTKAEQLRYAGIIKRLENVNFFSVPMLVMFTGVEFSTSSRIPDHRDRICKLSDYFRENIVVVIRRQTEIQLMIT